ncbi:MAG TPA: hemerythrin domain-containing protein [Polyangia bacterium]|nr:hemerythrin domain-containing protein [Polyangia bacterium]
MSEIRELLERDHERLDGLLRAAASGLPSIDRAAFGEFRAGLLRHIGLEEKILLPTARRLRGGEPLEAAHQLKLDHAALAALLVPTPTAEIVSTLTSLLTGHNALEEGPAGVYAACDELAGAEMSELVTRLRAAPPVATAPHYDGPRAFAAIDRLLRAAGRAPA